MFISFSKTIAKFGGFRLGVGMRVTKNNAVWMSFVVLFIELFKLIWYMIVFAFWLAYIICYGLYLGTKKLVIHFAEKQRLNEQTKNEFAE